MNCTKLLNELMMKYRQNLKLNKHFLLTLMMSLSVQVIYGLNFAYAMSECFELKQKYCAENLEGSKNLHESETLYKFWHCHIKDPQKFSDVNFEEHKEYLERAKNDGASLEELINYANRDIRAFKEEITKAINDSDNKNLNLYKLKLCQEQATLNWLQQGSAKKSNSSFNQTLSSSSSSQSNKKANRQSANNQSSSSSSSDLTNKSQEQLFEILDSAENRGDYAQAYAAEKQLAKDPSEFIKRQALLRIGYRYAEGRGVNQNLNEARRNFEQASSMGDLDASANLCVFHLLGKGVPENHKKAMEYCLLAAEKGHATAQNNLAWLYQSGNGIHRDKALSDMWTCKAAAQGDEMAVSNAKKAKISCN